MSVAAVLSAATVVNSCKSELGEAKKINLDETPSQVVEGIFHIQSQNGLLQLRVEADRMERYVNDSVSYEIFPEGFNVFVYNEEGLLETEITSLNAMHSKSDEDGEKWEAYGDVVVKNIIKGEWMYSPSGFMQGYGIISDQRARNSKILRPFDNFAIINNDSTKTYIDSVNFIGPIL